MVSQSIFPCVTLYHFPPHIDVLCLKHNSLVNVWRMFVEGRTDPHCVLFFDTVIRSQLHILHLSHDKKDGWLTSNHANCYCS